MAALEAKLMEDRLVKRLMASIKCGSCGQCYEAHNIEVLGHSEDTWFLRARCSSCHIQCLVVAIIKEERMPEFITDLTKAELDKFSNLDGVEADDVLNMHDFLRGFDGDFSRLFG